MLEPCDRALGLRDAGVAERLHLALHGAGRFAGPAQSRIEADEAYVAHLLELGAGRDVSLPEIPEGRRRIVRPDLEVLAALLHRP